MACSVTPIAINSNYTWAIHNSTHCIIVDPAKASPVLNFLKQHNLTLTAILITHHHHDHTAGLTQLHTYTDTIYGPNNSNISHLTHTLSHQDQLTLNHHTYNIIETPGHTLDHISYYTTNRLFCGDVLFSGGCGRIFEGSPKQAFDSIQACLRLPNTTNIYCGHEYTLDNLTFALTIDPNNPHLNQYYQTVNTLRQSNQPTLPSTIELEKNINPFCRCDQAVIQDSVKQKTGITPQSALETFTLLRQLKDNF